MLTTAEKRFVKYWEEQRAGGKFKYFLLYILAGTFIAILVLAFLYSLIFAQSFTMDFGIYAIIITSFITVTFLTILTWGKNEKRFKNIIKREIREGQQKDDRQSDEKLV